MAELEGARALALTFGIEKVDEVRREVWGIATAEVPDKQRDIVDFEASVRAFRAWGGNVREQHNKLKTVGKAIAIEPLPEQKAIRVGVFLSRSADGEDAWTKVREGILTGFSIGGTVRTSRPEIVKSEGFNSLPQTYNRITGYDLGELSLVDNPACPVAKFDLVKASGGLLHATAILAKDDDGDEVGEAFRQPLRSVISDAEDKEKQRILDDHSQPGVPASVRGITHGIDAHKTRLLNAVDGVLTKASRRTTVAKSAPGGSVTFVGTQGLTATWGDGGNLVIEKTKQPSGGWNVPGAQAAPGGAPGVPPDDDDEDDDAVAPGAIPNDADQPMPDNSGNPQSIGAAPDAPVNPSSKTYDDGTENLDGPDNADQQPDQSSRDGSEVAGMPQSSGQPGANGQPGAQGFGAGGDARDPHGSQWADSLDDAATAGGMPVGTIATHYTPESAQAHADALERGTGQAHDIVGDGDAFHVRPFPEDGTVTPDDIVGTHFSRDAAEDKRQKIESRGGFPAAVHQTPDGRYQVFPVPAASGGASGQVAPDGSVNPAAGQQFGGSPAARPAMQSGGESTGLPPDPRMPPNQAFRKADVSHERRGSDGRWADGSASFGEDHVARRASGATDMDPLFGHSDHGLSDSELSGRIEQRHAAADQFTQAGDHANAARARQMASEGTHIQSLRAGMAEPIGQPKWAPGENTPDALGRHNATYKGGVWDIHSFMRRHETGTRDDPSVHYAITGRGEPHDHPDRREITGAAASDLQDHFEGGNHFDHDVATKNPNHRADWDDHVDNVADEAIEEHDYQNGTDGNPDGPSPRASGGTGSGGTGQVAVHQRGSNGRPERVIRNSPTAGGPADPLGTHSVTYRGGTHAIHHFHRHGASGTADDPTSVYAVTGRDERPDDQGRAEITGKDASALTGGGAFDLASHSSSPDQPEWARHKGWDNHVDHVAAEAIGDQGGGPGTHASGNVSDVHRDHLGNFTLTPAGGGTGHPHAQYLQGDDASQFHQELKDHAENGRGSRANRVDDAVDPYIPDAARSPGKGQPGWHATPDAASPVNKTVENLMKAAQALTSRQSDQAEIAAVRDALLLLSRTLAKADAGVTAPKIPLYTKPRRNADGVDPDGYNNGGQHDAVSDDDEEEGQTVGASAGSQPGEMSRPLAGSVRTATVTKRAEAPGGADAASGNEWDEDDDPDAEHDMTWDGNQGEGTGPASPGPLMGKADDMGYGQEAGGVPDGIDEDGDGDGEVNDAGGASADAGAMKGISARRLRSTIHTEVAKALAIDGPATQSLQKVVSTTVGNVLKAVLAGHEDRLSDIERRSAALDAMDARLRAIEAQPMPSSGGPAMRAVEKSMGDLPGATGLERRIGEPRSGVIDRLRQRTLNKSDVSALEAMLDATDGHDRQAIGNVLALQDLKNMYR